MAWLKEHNIQGREAYWANIFRFFRGEWAKRGRLFTLSWCSYCHRFKIGERKSPVNDLGIDFVVYHFVLYDSQQRQQQITWQGDFIILQY